MGSGLSMTSVNKIKELAEAREYSLAVDILDSQDLEKSLNPQFLRVCGEVYENVGRICDARNMYVKAHIMGPQSNRIIYSLITFYLKQGYFGLAEQYRDQFIATAMGQERKNIEYVMKKAKGAKPEELREYLDPYYVNSMDEEWSFELFLLLTLMKADTEMLAADYRATFKRSDRSEIIREVLNGKQSPEELFSVFAKSERPDNDPEQEEIRELEKEQLRKDWKRLHPESVQDDMPEVTVDTPEGLNDSDAEILEEPDTEKKFKSFLKKTFRKKKENTEEGSEENTEQAPEASENAEGKEPAEGTAEATETSEEKPAGAEAVEPAAAAEEPKPEEETVQLEEAEAPAPSAEAPAGPAEADPDHDHLEDMLSIDFDDGFAAESEMASDLDEEEETVYQNPLDLINLGALYREEIAEAVGTKEEPVAEEAVEETVTEPEPVEEPIEEPIAEEAAEEAVTEPEPVEEPVEEPIAEEAVTEPEPVEEPVAEEAAEEAVTEPEPVEEPIEEPIAEEAAEEAVTEPEPIEEPVAEETVEEAATEPEPIEEPVAEEAAEQPAVLIEEEPEVFEDEEPISWEEPAVLIEEELEAFEDEVPISWEEPEAEPEPESIEEEPEAEPEPEPIEEEPEAEPEPEPIVAAEPVAEPEPVVPAAQARDEREEERQAARTALDALAENEKLDEGLLEEERLQREAEALLASLGIKL